MGPSDREGKRTPTAITVCTLASVVFNSDRSVEIAKFLDFESMCALATAAKSSIEGSKWLRNTICWEFLLQNVGSNGVALGIPVVPTIALPLLLHMSEAFVTCTRYMTIIAQRELFESSVQVMMGTVRNTTDVAGNVVDCIAAPCLLSDRRQVAAFMNAREMTRNNHIRVGDIGSLHYAHYPGCVQVKTLLVGYGTFENDRTRKLYKAYVRVMSMLQRSERQCAVVPINSWITQRLVSQNEHSAVTSMTESVMSAVRDVIRTRTFQSKKIVFMCPDEASLKAFCNAKASIMGEFYVHWPHPDILHPGQD